MKCAIHSHAVVWRSFDGGIGYRSAGHIADCYCEECRKARKRYLTRKVGERLHAKTFTLQGLEMRNGKAIA